ncbi:MAG: ATP-binding cassette domain-containing protein [Planctomycetota bacterium]
MQEAIFDIRNVSYKLGPKTILDGIDWRVKKGEHWAILGPNGAGKTTLLRVACGYVWPNAGGKVYRTGPTPAAKSIARARSSSTSGSSGEKSAGSPILWPKTSRPASR